MVAAIHLSRLRGTPVFIVASNEPEFNRVYGATYIPQNGVWAFPAFHPFAQFVERDLSVIDITTTWTEEAKAHLEEQKRYPEYIDKQVYDPRFKWVTQPYAHQIQAFCFGLYNLRAGLFLDMGLGKTKVVCDILRYEKMGVPTRPQKTLAIAPLVVLYKWADEVALHSGGELHPVVVDGTPKNKRKCLDADGDVYICTFGTASSEAIREYIAEKLDYQTIVIDESHNLQTHNSDKTKAITYLSRKASRRILMSGTASLGDPRHLWGQLDTLGPFLHEQNYWKFLGRYVQYGDEQRRIVVGFKNLDLLQRRMNLVGLRRKKEECLDLPPRTFVEINYKLTKEQKDTYNDLVRSSKQELEEKLRIIEEATPAARLTKLLQICSAYMNLSNKNPRVCDECIHLQHCIREKIHPYTKQCMMEPVAPAPTVLRFQKNPKLEAARELLEMQLAEPTKKAIIWAHFLEELRGLEQMIEDMGVGYVSVDGSVSPTQVRERVAKFQNDDSCRVYIGQISTGVGIDLTRSSFALYFSLDYNLGSWLQSLDRNYRIGQAESVTVYTLLAKGSVEEAVYWALQAKDDIRVALTDPDYNGPSEFLRKVTRPEEIAA